MTQLIFSHVYVNNVTCCYVTTHTFLLITVLTHLHTAGAENTVDGHFSKTEMMQYRKGIFYSVCKH